MGIGRAMGVLMAVAAVMVETACATPVIARPIGVVDGRTEYRVVCHDYYGCLAARDKACPQGHRDISYTDEAVATNGVWTWDFEFVCVTR
jgi:hypothetical protein